MSNKNAVITGATHGIGKAIAAMLLEQGYHILICARNAQELEDVQREWAVRFPNQSVYVHTADLADRAQLNRLAGVCVDTFGTVQVLVNNAGVFEPGQLATEPEGQLKKMMDINLYAPYHLTRAMLPHMPRHVAAHIFNICSVASLKAYPNGGAYSVTKYALMGFSDNLREELKEEGIRVTALFPGATDSRSWAGADVSPERIMEARDVAILVRAALELSTKAVVEHMVLRPQLGDL